MVESCPNPIAITCPSAPSLGDVSLRVAKLAPVLSTVFLGIIGCLQSRRALYEQPLDVDTCACCQLSGLLQLDCEEHSKLRDSAGIQVKQVWRPGEHRATREDLEITRRLE